MTKKIILKSTHPEEYPDLEIECKVIPNAEIGAYVASIPEERKFTAYKSAPVEARRGVVGEKIVTTLKVMLAGKEYILKEETGIVKERTYQSEEKEITEPDVVVTNVSSTSSEEYIVKHEKFTKTYSPIGYCKKKASTNASPKLHAKPKFPCFTSNLPSLSSNKKTSSFKKSDTINGE